MGWIDEMWAEINRLPKVDQLIRTSEIITLITMQLQPALGAHRRQVVLDLLAAGMDSQSVAELSGMRRSTVVRLAAEGRQDGLRAEVTLD